MHRVRTGKAMQVLSRRWREAGRQVGFVPTMGCLHRGHLSLVQAARKRVGRTGAVVVSIYVNPAQFGPGEDYTRYPRPLGMDLRLCEAAGVDAVFVPSDREMYPCRNGIEFSTSVEEAMLTRSMEGVSRPSHFKGVTTVVAVLFNLVQPDVAIFGAKDWQQAVVISKMVMDLRFPLEVKVAPTVREADGLAMSSRNAYLDPEDRRQAVCLHQALRECRAQVRASRRGVPVGRLRETVEGVLASYPQARLDYVEFFEPRSLAPLERAVAGSRMALAVRVGRTRLIDNGAL